MKVLAINGISEKGVQIFKKAGFEVLNKKVASEQLPDFINQNQVVAIITGSNTVIGKDFIDACPGLKIIGRGGSGFSNIDLKYAQNKDVTVVNTPFASVTAVAELVFAHLFSGIRFLHDANRNMPLEGDMRFKDLRKSYAGGRELRGKTLGIIGFGKIGQEVAKVALGLGMKVIASDETVREENIQLEFFGHQNISIPVKTEPLHQVIRQSDFITLHISAQKQKEPLIGEVEINAMKDGAGIINTSRGGIIDEDALLEALEKGKLAFAGLDAFKNEPSPGIKLLMNEKVSLSPRTGGITIETRERINVELAEKITAILQDEI
ncbi:NAD(P)-dependent oxidoreductase [Autumnicola musiva]|uniref:NAD(P)-dependent oxidoreductase n=1 Tax=Autumnicola musiva TaxID=3075589 RepID=A0ABU3D5N6_9FLAO|nr:NAD(P)-dependent oxidoreductase [Zunongwangia sp. F117]MDT0676845.1 NAD(P)-dependent oxidoreductase [Zunongwangia sp. F117]